MGQNTTSMPREASEESEKSRQSRDSNGKPGAGDERNGNDVPMHEGEMSEIGSEDYIRGPRFRQVMENLKRIHKLQQEASKAQMNADTQARKVAIRREVVGSSDAAFMKEVQLALIELQKLLPQRQLEKLKNLNELAGKCQAARDALGPVEEKEFRLRGKWYGSIWRMEQAQEEFFTEFAPELETADTYSSIPSSRTSDADLDSSPGDSREYTPPVEPRGQQITEIRVAASATSSRDLSPLTPTADIEVADLALESPATMYSVAPSMTADFPHASQFDEESLASYSDPAAMAEDLDRLEKEIPILGFPDKPPEEPPPDDHHSSTESFTELITDFATKRDRINKWLLQTKLLNRMEAFILRGKLNIESPKAPSAWAQLIIAYYINDAAEELNGHAKTTSTPPLPYTEIEWNVYKSFPDIMSVNPQTP